MSTLIILASLIHCYVLFYLEGMPLECMCGSNLYGGDGVGQAVPERDSSPGTIDKQLLGPWLHSQTFDLVFFSFHFLISGNDRWLFLRLWCVLCREETAFVFEWVLLVLVTQLRVSSKRMSVFDVP